MLITGEVKSVREINAYNQTSIQPHSDSDVKVSEVNTIFYGKCIKIWVDERFQQTDGRIGVDVGLQMLEGANHSVKVYFNRENSVTNLITGFHPEVNAFEVKPHTAAYCQLRCT